MANDVVSKVSDTYHLESTVTNLDEKMQGAKLNVFAKEGTIIEHELSVYQAVKAYPAAIFWSFMVSMCVVMEGYDTILIGNLFAYPEFAKKYGQFVDSNGAWQLTAAWQAGLGNAAGVGAFFGVLANGYLVHWFGQKRVLLGALIILSGFVFMTFFAPNIQVLTAGELLCGLPWGVFASSGPAYASEVLPLSLRVYMTSYTNMCFIIGQLIAAGVLDGLVSNTTQWSYRIPFALQWMWPSFLIPILIFAPESPWHLVRKGRLEEAEKCLRRLQRQSAPIDPKQTLAVIVHTNNLEEELTTGTTYWDCFKGPERRRTEIACISFAGQVLGGSSFANNATYFFQQVGLPTTTIYKLSAGGNAMALFATLLSWFLLTPYFGRRTIYLCGMLLMTIILFIIGFLNIRTGEYGYEITQAVLTLCWTFVFQLSIGQLGWALPAEMGSTRLRQKTVCVARNAYYIVSVIAGVLDPYMLNPQQWNLKGFTGFFWGGIALCTLIWAYFRLPETKGRTFDELDILFAKNISARKFKGTQVDAFDEQDVARLGAKSHMV